MNQTAIALAGLGLLLILGTPATAWTTDLTLSSGGRTEVLTLGSEDGASDEFDTGIDIPLPPPPPTSPFSAYIIGNGLFEMLQTDIRATYAWSIYVVSEGDIDVIWNAAPVPLTMTLGEDRFSLTESGNQSLGSGECWISIQGDNNPYSSDPADPDGDSPSPSSTVSDTPSVAVSTASTASMVTPDKIQERMPLPLTTLIPNTPVRNTSDSASSSPYVPHLAEGNPIPGFGALLTLLGVSVLVITLRNRQMK